MTEEQLSGQREKQSVAATSLAAAIGLTTFKIIVGISTGSLGILAEAAHSGLDLVAALLTFLAVRVSSRPADRTHLYGHGKYENFSALAETLLLLVTCAWIIWGATERIRFHKVDVEVTVWSFAVMLTSIGVDVSRSRVLASAARKYHSQALEADALHFETDVWSSAVVILGLVCVKLGEAFPRLSFLQEADAIAAIGVAVIVIFASLRLGMRTIHALLDAAPAGLQEQIIRTVESVPGVVDCHHVRLRYVGPRLFIDVHVLVNGDQTLRQAHDITDAIEQAVEQSIPDADIVVHPEPVQ